MKKHHLIFIALLITLTLMAGCASQSTQSGKTPKDSPTASDNSTGNPFLNTKPSASPSEKPSPSTSASAGTSASASPKASASAKPAETGTAPSAAGTAAVSGIKFDYKSQYIDTSVTLPQVSGLGSAAQSKINAVFSDAMATAKKSNTSSEAESKQLVQEAGADAQPYVIDISYTVPYNSKGVLCLQVSDYRYLGGAHGGVSRTSYLFDTKSGATLTLGDLMQTGSAYKKTINAFIRKEIDKRTATSELAELETFKDIGDTPDFYLTSEEVVFYFQEYEYFPYAAGIQEFAMPYDSLSAFLKKEYTGLKITPTVLKQDAKNSLAPGGIGRISLDGNQTTGYSWKYEIGDANLIELADTAYSDAQPGLAGAGSTYTWDFRALKPGTTTIVFSYTRDWESNTPGQDKTVKLTVTVK